MVSAIDPSGGVSTGFSAEMAADGVDPQCRVTRFSCFQKRWRSLKIVKDIWEQMTDNIHTVARH